MEYTLIGIRNEPTGNTYSISFSGDNWVTGEALYRLVYSNWANPWEVMLNINSNKSGKLTVKRSPNTPSEAQKLKANAIANEMKEGQHG